MAARKVTKKADKVDGPARGGIQALDAALHLLRVMGDMPGPVALSDLARQAGMTPTKAHRYLASFLHAGFAVQGEPSGRYDLGPAALRLGLAGVSRNDFVNRAADRLSELASTLHLTTLLAVWGPGGPTVVRWERSPSLTNTSLGLGSVLPLLNSAGGRLFLSYLPRGMTASFVADELKRAREADLVIADVKLARPDIDGLVETIRRDGIACVDGGFIAGLRAAATPILNWQGEIETAVIAIGTRDDILRLNSPTHEALKEFAANVSLSVQTAGTS